MASPAILRKTLLFCLALCVDSLEAAAPVETALMASRITIMASTMTSVTARYGTMVRATHVGLKAGRMRPMYAMPRPRRPRRKTWDPICRAFGAPFAGVAQSRNCSTEKRANWSNRVEKTTETWQAGRLRELAAVVINPVRAQAATRARKEMRASLRPSLRTLAACLQAIRTKEADDAARRTPLDGSLSVQYCFA